MADYRPGDIVNGHVLGNDLQWHPLQTPEPDYVASESDDGAARLAPDEPTQSFRAHDTQVLGYAGDQYARDDYTGDPDQAARYDEEHRRDRPLGLLVGAILAVAVVLVAIVLYAATKGSGPTTPSAGTSSPSASTSAATPTPTETPTPTQTTEPGTIDVDDVKVEGRRADDLDLKFLDAHRNLLGLLSTTIRVENTGDRTLRLVTVRVVVLQGEDPIARSNGLITSISPGQTVTTSPLSGDKLPSDTTGLTYEVTLE